MVKGGKPTRLKLFAQLEEDLRRNIIGKHDVILCPFCMKEFGFQDAESGMLTEEHVIPESTGGREVTLSCKCCNSKLGYKIDEQLARKVRLDRGFKDGEKLKAKVVCPSIWNIVRMVQSISTQSPLLRKWPQH
jgi:hypothetical protein